MLFFLEVLGDFLLVGPDDLGSRDVGQLKGRLVIDDLVFAHLLQGRGNDPAEQKARATLVARSLSLVRTHVARVLVLVLLGDL